MVAIRDSSRASGTKHPSRPVEVPTRRLVRRIICSKEQAALEQSCLPWHAQTTDGWSSWGVQIRTGVPRQTADAANQMVGNSDARMSLASFIVVSTPSIAACPIPSANGFGDSYD